MTHDPYTTCAVGLFTAVILALTIDTAAASDFVRGGEYFAAVSVAIGFALGFAPGLHGPMMIGLVSLSAGVVGFTIIARHRNTDTSNVNFSLASKTYSPAIRDARC